MASVVVVVLGAVGAVADGLDAPGVVVLVFPAEDGVAGLGVDGVVALEAAGGGVVVLGLGAVGAPEFHS